MERNTVINRQLAGCGYLPPPDKDLLPVVRAWNGLGYSGPDPTVCPGYSTNLPEVQEIARAHTHWSKGALMAWLRGQRASEALLIGIEIIEAEVGRFEAFLADEIKRKQEGR